MDNVNFARNLVKGKIAETIFAQMLRETKIFTVLDFGYEKIIPEIVQQGYDPNETVLHMLRSAPDFAVINQETRQVHLIEVKYMQYIGQEFVLRYAQKMAKCWNPSNLFVATLDGFYFGEIGEIIKNHGDIKPLHHSQIPTDIQSKYLKILQDFEGDN